MMQQEDRVFVALADSTRRQLLETLCQEGDKTATDLADGLPMTRQGVAKHLSILAKADLVHTRRSGRETIYSFNPEPLDVTITWVQAINDAWDRRLHALRDYLLGEISGEAD